MYSLTELIKELQRLEREHFYYQKLNTPIGKCPDPCKVFLTDGNEISDLIYDPKCGIIIL